MLDDAYYEWFAQHHTKRYFEFPEISPLPKIQFERLTKDNAVELFEAFAQDDSAFVDKRFKDLNRAIEYARFLETCGAYQAKHGSADWLVKAGGDHCACILHLYDLSLETFSQNHKRAWIGFSTAQPFRNQGLTLTVVGHFIQTLFNYYKQVDFIHAMTLPQNTASRHLLRKLGFVLDPEERMSKEHEFYILSRPSLS